VDDHIRQSLDHGHVIDITTTGRTSGLPRRIEIVFHNFGERIYISGTPSRRKRSWLANLEADPTMTVHLKGAVQADLPATARVVSDDEERRRIMPLVARVWQRADVEDMVAWSPLLEVVIPGYGAAATA
jgi:deazaflavin-dependent oxidoreductase (nitroreductase family)